MTPRPGSCAGLLLSLAAVSCGGPASPRPGATTVVIPRVAAAPLPPSPAVLESPRKLTAPEVRGLFDGQLWSRGHLVEVETDLALTAAGGSGSYEFVQDERRIRGDLGACQPTRDRQWRCEWLDELGTGKVLFRLSADLQSFDGEWWTDTEPLVLHPWNGSRVGTGRGMLPP